MSYEFRRARQNGENFENFTEECSEANDNLIKFKDLYLRSRKELLKSSPNVKTDVSIEELIDLSKLLKRSDLTTEERKYFRHRRDLIEKDINWEGIMKKLLADFPYEKDRYFPRID